MPLRKPFSQLNDDLYLTATTLFRELLSSSNPTLQDSKFFLLIYQLYSSRHRWVVPWYFFSTGIVGTLEKKYRYRKAGTFAKSFVIKNNKKVKSAQLHLYTFHSNRLKDLFLEYNAANPSSAAIERFFSQEKIF